jgi:hypothetical protein
LPHRHCAGVTTYQAGVKVGGETMGDRDDRLSAARQDLDLLTGDLRTARGQLEEFATMWRRQCHARNSWQDMPHAFPQGLRDAADGLAGTLRALVAAGPDADPDLALAAVTQLSALEAGLAVAGAGAGRSVTGDACGSTQLRPAAVWVTISRVRARQRDLIAHLLNGQEVTAARAA